MTPQTVSSRLWRQSEALGRPGGALEQLWEGRGEALGGQRGSQGSGGRLWEAKGRPRGVQGLPKEGQKQLQAQLYIDKLPINRTRGRYVIICYIYTICMYIYI